MIPNLHYDSESYETITTVAEYEKYVSMNTLLFLILPESFVHPFMFSMFEKNGRNLFTIDQRRGGPAFHFYSPGIIEQRDKRIGPGFLGIFPFYYNLTEKVLLTQEYKHLYFMLSKYLKTQCVRVKLPKHTFWVGRETIRLCNEEGYSTIDIGGTDVVQEVGQQNNDKHK